MSGFKVDPTFVFIAAAAFLLCAIYYFRGSRNVPSHVFTAVLIYTSFSKFLSTAFLDFHKVPISESANVSYPTDAWIWEGVFIVVNFAGVYLAEILWISRERYTEKTLYLRAPSSDMLRLVFWIAVTVLSLHYLNLIISGKLALPGSGADHWNYWAQYAVLKFLPSIFGETLNFIGFLAGGLVYWGTMRNERLARNAGVALAISYVLYLVCTGQRFNGLLMPSMILYGCFVSLTRERQGNVLNWKLVAGPAAFIILVMPLVLWDISHRGIGVKLGAENAFLYRVLVLQGHAFWNVSRLVETFNLSGDVSAFLSGIHSVMALIMPAWIYGAYLQRGVNIANFWPATSVYVLGYGWTVVTSFLYGLVYGSVCYFLYRFLRHGKILLLVPMSFIMMWVHGTYAQGSFEFFLTPAVPLVLLAFSILLYIDRLGGLDRHRRIALTAET